MDFDHIEKYKEHLSGDILFSMMGTTLKQAGSKDKQYKIDYTYQYDFAKYAEQEGVKTYILTSALAIACILQVITLHASGIKPIS